MLIGYEIFISRTYASYWYLYGIDACLFANAHYEGTGYSYMHWGGQLDKLKVPMDILRIIPKRAKDWFNRRIILEYLQD